MIVFNLDKLLAKRKMRSAELAHEIGWTVQTISRIKTGKLRAIRIETLDTLCAFFNCQPSDLLEYMSEEEAVERYGQDFVDSYREYFDLDS